MILLRKLPSLFLFIGSLSFHAFLQAQPIDDGSGLLKRLSHEAIEQQVQSTLIQQITITNIISNKEPY
ncbi:MAG TPA: hypothetical protein EYH20_02940, partial [Leucothrix sp.]|nr:hypothetical protein [Leucothrix sp.]